MNDLLPVSVVARRLCISRKRIYQLIESGHLDSLRPSPRSIRVTRESLERFIADGIRRQKEQLGLDIAPHRKS